jgi:hypothetical protein
MNDSPFNETSVYSWLKSLVSSISPSFQEEIIDSIISVLLSQDSDGMI